MSVLESVEGDLLAIRKRDEHLADSAMAAMAKQLARELDDNSNSATSKAMCSKALMETLDRLRELAPAETLDRLRELAPAETLDRLRELAPAEKEKDKVDDLVERRTHRREAAAKG